MGTGKTTTLNEASDILAKNGIRHAAIDLDALGVCFDPENADAAKKLKMQNLTSVWENYARAGIQKVLIASAVENVTQLTQIHEALGVPTSVLGRLIASLPTAEARVKARDCGFLQEKYVRRVAELNALIDSAALEAFTVTNDGRDITEVANEFLRRAGWLPLEALSSS